MSEKQFIKNKRVDDLAAAPTPQNTPATTSTLPTPASQPPTIPTIKEEDVATGNVFQNAAVLSMIQGKLGNLIGRSSGYIESLPAPVKKRLTGLKGLQAEYSKLELKFQEEILELEKKYLEKYRPLYNRRAEIINGVTEPKEDELAAGLVVEEENQQADTENEKEDDETIVQDTEMKGVPEFWLTAMKNVISIASLITSKDEEVLRHLTDIRLSYLDVPGFKIEFVFAENEFFTDNVLVKSYFYQQQAGYGGDFIYDHAEGQEIQWKEGKDLTVKIETKRQRNKNTNQTRIVKRSVPLDSFFNFFKPPVPRKDDPEVEEEEEDADELDERLELDYNIGEDIKEKLIPRAIDWFTGAALEYEEIDEDDLPVDYEDEFSEDEDDDEDEDDEDEDDEQGGKPKTEPAECKQQ